MCRRFVWNVADKPLELLFASWISDEIPNASKYIFFSLLRFFFGVFVPHSNAFAVVFVVLAVAEIIHKLLVAAVARNMRSLLANACSKTFKCTYKYMYIYMYTCHIYIHQIASLAASNSPTLHADPSGQFCLLLLLLAFQHFVWQTLQQQTGWLSVALGADRCV